MNYQVGQIVKLKAHLFENMKFANMPSADLLTLYGMNQDDIVKPGTKGVVAAVLPTAPITYGVDIRGTVYSLTPEDIELVSSAPISPEAVRNLFL